MGRANWLWAIGPLCALVGFAAGVGWAGWGSDPGDPNVTDPVDPRERAAPRPPPLPRAPLAEAPTPPVDEDALDALRRALEDAEAACALRIAASGGVEPLAWPDDLPRQAQVDAFHALIDEASEHCDWIETSLLEVDCGEFPCGAFFAASSTDLEGCGQILTPPGGPVAIGERSVSGRPVVGIWALPDPQEVALDHRAMGFRQSVRLTQAADLLDSPD